MTRSAIRARLASPTPFGHALARAAIAEHEAYHEHSETDALLRDRIRNQYCRELGFAAPRNVSGYAWSAVFVSWCVKAAGASEAEFAFAQAHSVFVHAAISNAIHDRGVFRGFPIDQVAPQIGDIIQHNRLGNRYTYEHARDERQYPSHSAIVVDILDEGGGASPSRSVAMKAIASAATGSPWMRAGSSSNAGKIPTSA